MTHDRKGRGILSINVILGINWFCLVVSFVINIVRVALLDKTPFIPWLYFGLWIFLTLLVAFFAVRYVKKNAGKIVGKTAKSMMKGLENFTTDFEKEIDED